VGLPLPGSEEIMTPNEQTNKTPVFQRDFNPLEVFYTIFRDGNVCSLLVTSGSTGHNFLYMLEV